MTNDHAPQPDPARYLQLARQWRELIDARGRGPEYSAERLMQLEWVLARTGYHLTDATVQIAIGRLRDAGKSARTCEKYLASAKSFTCWLARPSARILPFDPLVELRPPNKRKDRRHVRTSFVPVLAALLASTAKSTRLYQGIGGVDRAELYHAAACTGLREGTLAVIGAGQFALDAAPPVVTVRADQVKDAEELVVPIQVDSAARLKAYLAGKMPTARAFRMPRDLAYVSRMLQQDLAEAGITYCREVALPNGRVRREDVLDFHALRGTFNTWCAENGVELTMRQRWMGHSDPRLTANVYGYRVPSGELAAVLRIPALPGVTRAAATTTPATMTGDAAAAKPAA